ncbi:Mu transposase C-terminal domain-containing protein [Paraburkholderia sp. RL17-337-BIB-A]|uniref:Mu transposase C-terminal domain-containing protein n=1 Tax=Paraburkholderia sp. RL17-337-BIB-A TaxID=3031636 RepID=UPI0038BA4B35
MAIEVRAVPTIALRELYQDTGSNKIYRIVFTGFGQTHTYLCHILGERLDLLKFDSQEFLRLLDPAKPDRRFVKYGHDPFALSSMASRGTPGQEQKSADNWRAIGPLVEGFDDDGNWRLRWLVDSATRARFLREHAAQTGNSVGLLYKLLRRYLQRGMNRLAVVGQYANCGHLRTNVLYTAGEVSEGPILSERITRKYEGRPGPPPGDTSHTFAVPSGELERLIEQHLDIYATWREGVWALPPEARALGRRIRKRARDERGLLAVNPARAARARTPSMDHRPARGKRSKPSLQDLTDSINYQLRRDVEVWDDGHLVHLVLRKTGVVTTRQVQWMWQKSRPDFVRRRKRHPGEKQLRPLPAPGRARQHVQGPGQQFLVDSTVLDVYVVSPLDRKKVLGRPTLYLIVDLYSGMIVGLYLGLEHPSREACAMAVVNTVTNKSEYCTELGFDIKDEDWPVCHLPFEFVADRGAEFCSTEPWTGLAQTIGVGMSNAPPRKPRWRGLAERRFGIVPRAYQTAAYGVVERDFNTRTGRRYAWDARYTCAEVELMLLRAIHVYHRTPVSGDQPPVWDMVNNHDANTPLNRWNYGIASGSGTLQTATPEEIRMAVWPKARGRLYRDGVLFKGIWYQCRILLEEFRRSEHGKGARRSQSVEVQFDPANLGEISVFVYGYRQTCLLDANRNVHQLFGVSLAEWEELRSKDRANRRAKKLAEQAKRYLLMQNTQMDNELAGEEQRKQLQEAGMDHPDASDMKTERAKQRRIDAEAVRSRRAAKAISKGITHADMTNKEEQPRPEPDAIEEFDDPLRDAMYGNAPEVV